MSLIGTDEGVDVRLLSYATTDLPDPRVGIEVDVGGISVVVAAQKAYARTLSDAMRPEMAARFAAALVPDDMTQVLAGGDDSLRALRTVQAYAREQLRTPADVAEWSRLRLTVEGHHLVRFPPVPRPGKILGVGSNYPSADDGGLRPETPVVFATFSLCLAADQATVTAPADADDLDFEGELAVVIGRPGTDIRVEDALRHVAGYTIANDLTRRRVLADERQRGAILFGKNFVGSAPCGPVLVTSDEIPNPQALTIDVSCNGIPDSSAATAAMLRSVAELIATCSRVPLEAGDLILTGAPKRPPGATAHRLEDHDRLVVRIPPIGDLVTTVGRCPSTHDLTPAGLATSKGIVS